MVLFSHTIHASEARYFLRKLPPQQPPTSCEASWLDFASGDVEVAAAADFCLQSDNCSHAYVRHKARVFGVQRLATSRWVCLSATSRTSPSLGRVGGALASARTSSSCCYSTGPCSTCRASPPTPSWAEYLPSPSGRRPHTHARTHAELQKPQV